MSIMSTVYPLNSLVQLAYLAAWQSGNLAIGLGSPTDKQYNSLAHLSK